MDVLGNLWKPNKIQDPFLSLTNLEFPKTQPNQDRFCLPLTPSLLTEPPSISENNPNITHPSNQQKHTDYLNLLIKTCRITKKQSNCSKYVSKIKRSGYMLDEEVSSIVEERNLGVARVIN